MATAPWAASTTTGVLPQVWYSPLARPVSSLPREAVLRSALLASASGVPFEDVKFYAFSRRSASGLVDTPMPLLANSAHIRKASSHFDYLLTQGFAESGVMDMDGPYPSTRPNSTEDYVYDSDSDLEDERVQDEATRLGGLSDEDSSKPSLGPTKVPRGSRSSAVSVPQLTGNSDGGKPGRTGRVVFIDDFAYKTWKAFIFYAYLGETELSFAPLQSEQKPCPPQPGPDSAPICSPKSMYRLAEKYDIAPLKKLAADEIKKRLSPSNILEEVFSDFSSLYPELRTMEVEYLHTIVGDKGVQDRLPTWVEAMEDGHLPKGAATVVVELVSKLLMGSVPSTSGMKRCPGGCSNSTYTCSYCRRSF
ncbi:hypothetical protein C8Q79DRAFT_911621 [Trametes meyenii]|nr:hypothetical protein C8Q79DRAFT_911621 [Trametes meyenii]